MASVVKLGKQKQPPRAIDIVDDMDDKKRKRIRLGVVSHDFAEEACRRIEKLMAAKTLNQSLDHETQRWLVGISDVIHERIAKTGLCQPRQPKAVMTLSGWALKYISQRGTELKPRSIKSIEHTVDKLIACFGSDVSIAEITVDRATDWRAGLLAQALSEASVRLHCRNAKTLFNAAVERELIPKNPFGRLKSSAIAANRDRFVTRQESSRILEACPNVQWRLLFALCRFGGLRCSSETHGVTWDCVDWTRKRLRVFSPKTNTTRSVPIVPALMTLLEEAFHVAPDGSIEILTLGTNNLHRSFQRILTVASIDPWEDAFQTLRRSCETDLSQRHPQYCVSTWIGHSMAVSEKHYLQVSDEMYEKAAADPVMRLDQGVKIERTPDVNTTSSDMPSAAASPRTSRNEAEFSSLAGGRFVKHRNEKTHDSQLIAAKHGSLGSASSPDRTEDLLIKSQLLYRLS